MPKIAEHPTSEWPRALLATWTHGHLGQWFLVTLSKLPVPLHERSCGSRRLSWRGPPCWLAWVSEPERTGVHWKVRALCGVEGRCPAVASAGAGN